MKEKIDNSKLSIDIQSKVIFICSPYKGNIALNIANAKKYSRFAAMKGNIVFCPHLLYPQFLNDENEYERNIGILSGIHFLEKCNEIWIFAKDYAHCTDGMKKEIDESKKYKSISLKFIDPEVING